MNDTKFVISTNASSTANTITIIEVSAAEQRRRIDQAIARRAYEISETRGGAASHPIEDWRQAESEVRCRLCFGLTTSIDSVVVGCDADSFERGSLELWVAPRQITICGKPQPPRLLNSKSAPLYGGTVFRVIVLPAVVAPHGVFAYWKDHVLEIHLPITRMAGIDARARAV